MRSRYLTKIEKEIESKLLSNTYESELIRAKK
jgi:hypothetical protein